MEKKKRDKLIVLTVCVVAILIIVLGTSYAFLRFSLSGANQELVAGQIYMHYKEGSKQINIEEAIPSTSYDENQYFQFTIDGKNTSSNDIWYAITLAYGEAPAERDTKLEDRFLKFTLFENDNKVVDGANYKSLNNKKLWVNKIDKSTNQDISITYKLYMWISDEVNISDDGDYDVNTWNNKVYASVKVNVVGDFTEKKIDKPDGSGPVASGLAATILEKAYSNDRELIAIDKAGNKCQSLKDCDVREYRYIGPGVNNYIYLKDNRGYNETWRIIGLFLNDEGTEWNLKVVRDEILPGDYLPSTYVINDAIINGSSKKVTYTIRYLYSSDTYSAYWNMNNSGTQLNRWEEAGLQYYLNTEHDDSSEPINGYLSYLSNDTKELLAETTYYLGTVQSNTTPRVTPKEAYLQERKINGCDGKGTASSWDTMQDTDCLVYNGNATTWKGKVSLMYPSDYGLSASDANWTTPMYGGDSANGFEDSSVNSTTWMYKTMSDPKSKHSWFLSPSSIGSYSATYWRYDGYVSDNSIYATGIGVRPVLYLSSLATSLDGEGTYANPYRLFKKEEKLEGLAKTIVDKAYTNENEMIAIDVSDKNNIKKCDSVASCQGKEIEYRYSGQTVNNYVYLKNSSGNEKWRIIGVFYNDITEEWNIKVVRNEILSSGYLPAKYVINEAVINESSKKVTYTIQYDQNVSDWKTLAYWNKNDGTQLNRWEESGLQYYLNTEKDSESNLGYLRYLSSETKDLLVETTYYLGTVKSEEDTLWTTPKEAYLQERKVTGCVDGKGTADSWDAMKDTECNVWSGNASTWKGKVGLMYPSDYGLSASEANWTTALWGGDKSGDSDGFEDAAIRSTTWMYNTIAEQTRWSSWLISPASGSSHHNFLWYNTGKVIGLSFYYSVNAVRPVLYLSAKATRIDGDGTSGSPYVILK